MSDMQILNETECRLRNGKFSLIEMTFHNINSNAVAVRIRWVENDKQVIETGGLS